MMPSIDGTDQGHSDGYLYLERTCKRLEKGTVDSRFLVDGKENEK